MANKSILFVGNSRQSQVLWNQTTGVKALMLRGGLMYVERATSTTGWHSVEAPDVFTGLGNVGYVGTFNTIEAPDVFSAHGGIPDTGVWNDVENPDRFSAFVFVPPSGTFNVTEAPDTMGNGRQERFEVESIANSGNGSTFSTGGPDRIICVFVGAYAAGSSSDHVTAISDSTGLTWHLQDYLDIGRDELGEQLHTEMWWAYAHNKITNASLSLTLGGGFSFTHNMCAMMIVKGAGSGFNNPFSDTNPYSYGSNYGGFVTPPLTHIAAKRPVATGALSSSGSVTNPATFNPITVQGVTLDGTHLKVTSVGSGGPHNYATLPTTMARVEGLIYLEVKFVHIAGSKYGFGFAWTSDSAANINTVIDDGTGGFIIRGDGTIWSGGVNAGNVGCVPADGDVIGIALDIAHNAVWARDVTQGTPFNNNTGSLPQYSSAHFGAGGLIGTPSFAGDAPPTGGAHIGLGGYLLPIAAPDGTSASAEIDANFGGSAFVGTVPPGYQAGWGTPAPAVTPTRVEQHALVIGWDISVPDDGIAEAPPGFTLNYARIGDASAGFRLSVYSKIIAQNILTTDTELMTHPSTTKHWAMMYDTLVAGHISPGTLESTEAPDTAHMVGYGPGGAGVFGSLTTTEAKDTFAAVGAGPVVGLWTSIETTDAFSAFISVPIHLTFNATEARDTFAGTGIGRGEDGTWISTEPVDILTISGIVPIIGSFDTTETADRFRAIGAGVTTSRRRRRRNFVT